MDILIFIIYLLLFSYFIYVIPFFKNSGIGRWKLLALFGIKILAGIAYALFYRLPQNFAGSDTWRYFRQSLKETDWLLTNPIAFCKDLFTFGYSRAGNMFSGENSYWNDLKSNVLIKLMALTNVFTGKGYYANIIIFNFVFLFGLVALFKVFNNVFPRKKYLIIVTIFLLPSTLFWCSGIHKDGLILSATGTVIYLVHTSIQQRFTIKKIAIIALCLALTFSLRNYVALALLPPLLCWYAVEKWRLRSFTAFAVVYIVGIAAFFILPYISASLNFPAFLANKQNEFLHLEGSSAVTLIPLQPTAGSYLSYLPLALDMAFFRPHIGEIKSLSYLPAIAEVWLLLAVVILSIFLRKRETYPSAFWLFIFFSVSVLLIAGFTITFSGAIVRYRSFALPLLITPLVCVTNTQFLKKRFSFLNRNRMRNS